MNSSPRSKTQMVVQNYNTRARPPKSRRNRPLDQAPDVSWIWHEHLPLLTTAASILFITIRVLVISDFNIETAYGVIQASGAGDIVIVSVLPTLGFLAPSAAVTLLTLFLDGTISKRHKRPVISAIVFLGFISIIITPAGFFPLALTGALIVISFRYLEIPARPSVVPSAVIKSLRFIYNWMFLSTIVFTIALSIVSSVPWVPSEVIVTKNIKHRIVGYVLAESDTDTTILTFDAKVIVHISPSELTSRTVCQPQDLSLNGPVFEPVAQWLFGHATTYPPCNK